MPTSKISAVKIYRIALLCYMIFYLKPVFYDIVFSFFVKKNHKN